MNETDPDHVPSDGPIGSYEETRRWQIRRTARLTTPAERLDMVEELLKGLGDDRVRKAIEQRLALQQAAIKGQ